MKIKAEFKLNGQVVDVKEFDSDIDFYTARRVWVSRGGVRRCDCDVVTGKQTHEEKKRKEAVKIIVQEKAKSQKRK